MESVAVVGVGGERREEAVEVGLVSAIAGEACVGAKMVEVFWVSCGGEGEQERGKKREKCEEH